jgi:hypothetical protein
MKFEKTLKELHELTMVKFRPERWFPCNLISSMFANLLLDEIPKSYIIESSTHCVVFDGDDTWDLTYGCMFKDYKYPSVDIPNHTLVPYFDVWWREPAMQRYYSREALLKASDFVLVKEIKHIGQINGTEKT